MTTDTESHQVSVWYDYICPWCYVGLDRLDRLSAEFTVTLKPKPFLLRPGTPKEGKPRELRAGEVEGELAEPLKTYAKEAGLIMRRPPIVAYSMYALEATEYAKDQGLFDPCHRGMYKA